MTITNEQIDKAIIDSLIGTQLGQKISHEIEKCFDTGYGSVDMNRIVRNIVEAQIHKAIEQILLTTHAKTIEAFVATKMTDAFVTATFEAMWDSWNNKR